MSAAGDIWEDGTFVRVTGKSISGDPELDSGAADIGEELTVFSYALGTDGDDPNGLPYYLLDNETTIGGYAWAYPEHVEVLKTAAQLASRRAPAMKEVRSSVASALMSMYDPIEVDETDFEGDDAVSVYGRTNDGLRVGFRVRIDQIEETDF